MNLSGQKAAGVDVSQMGTPQIPDSELTELIRRSRSQNEDLLQIECRLIGVLEKFCGSSVSGDERLPDEARKSGQFHDLIELHNYRSERIDTLQKCINKLESYIG